MEQKPAFVSRLCEATGFVFDKKRLPSLGKAKEKGNMDYKDAYLERTQAQLEQLGAEVEQLKAQADSAKAAARFTYREHLKTLREKQEAATTRLRQLKGAGDETFEDMRIGADRAAQDLRSSLEEARSRFG